MPLWVRRWWREKRNFHSHGVYGHSHPEPDIDHDHALDQCCGRSDCWDYPLHRVHPTRVL